MGFNFGINSEFGRIHCFILNYKCNCLYARYFDLTTKPNISNSMLHEKLQTLI